MGDAASRMEGDNEIDRLWVGPEAVLHRYGERGDALAAGPSVYGYRQPAIDWYGYALGHLHWTGREQVLDAGCGRGAYLPHIAKRLGPSGRLVGLDFSPAMARMAVTQGPDAHIVVGDVQTLPLASDSVDLVICAHMLYHVPDIRAAVAEFRRVLRHERVLALIVGSARDQQEFDDLFLTAGGAFPLLRYSERFTADNAPRYLEGIFSEVEKIVVTPELVITDAEAVVWYFVSQRTISEAALRPGVSWEGFIAEVRHITQEAIAREGAFRVSEEIAMLIAR